MSDKLGNAFDSRGSLATAGGEVVISRLDALAKAGVADVGKLPYSIKVLLEAVLRNVDGFSVLEEHVRALAAWDPHEKTGGEIRGAISQDAVFVEK